MSDPEFPEPTVETRRGRSLSWVWLLPLIALAISGAVVWRTYRDQGPLIVVTFPDASGMEAGQTPLRFRNVEVGLVEEIEFAEGFTAVEAHIRIDRDIADYIDEDAAFWLVEPRVTAQGVSGLNTVLSGVYIEATWDGVAGRPQERFEALRDVPLALPGEEGTQIVLRSRDGGKMAEGAPVLFNGIEVGRLGAPELSEGGSSVSVEAFIRAPHDARLSTNTRFWDISGIAVDLGTAGLSVNFDSIASLIEGGVAFDTLVTGGTPIEGGHVYEVFSSQREARLNAFEAPVAQAIELSVLLPADDLRLTDGALVRFGGLRVGEVTDITGYVDPEATDGTVQILVTFTVAPDRIGLAAATTREELLDALAARVEDGLRVRVASEGLLGGTLILELADLDLPPETGALQLDVVDAPLIPAAPSDVTQSPANLEAIVTRVADLPIEELFGSAIDALDSVTAIAAADETRALPANANALIADTSALVTSEELRTAIADLSAAAADLRALTTQIAESEGVGATLTALESSDEIAADLAAFSGGLDGTLDTVDALLAETRETIVARLAALPVEELFGATQEAVDGVTALATSAETQALPGNANALVTETRALVASEEVTATLDTLAATAAELQALVTRLSGSEGLTAALTALEATDEIAADIRTATEGLPATAAEVDALLADVRAGVLDRVAALPIEELLGTAQRTLDGVDLLANSPETQALPGDARALVAESRALLASEEVAGTLDSLSAAATDLQALVAEITASEGVTTALTALEASDEIVADLQAFTDTLPGITESVNALIADLQEAPIAEVAASADRVLQRTEEILNAEGVEDLPGALDTALTELTAVLAELREGGAVDSLTATLASAEEAFAALEGAAEEFPALVARIDGLVGAVRGVAGDYSSSSRLYGEVRNAIGEAVRTAEALRSLARTIERNPSAILTGR